MVHVQDLRDGLFPWEPIGLKDATEGGYCEDKSNRGRVVIGYSLSNNQTCWVVSVFTVLRGHDQ